MVAKLSSVPQPPSHPHIHDTCDTTKLKHPKIHTYIYVAVNFLQIMLAIYVTGYGKTCIVHTSNFANLKIHKI